MYYLHIVWIAFSKFAYMKIISTLFLLLFFSTANCQLLSWSPSFIQESSTPIEIIVDATKGNAGLLNYTPTTDVYVHTGVITNLSTSSTDWKHAPFTWATTPANGQCVYLGNNKWKFTITGGLRSFYNITNASEKVLRIAILFRNGAGTKVQRNTDGSDMYIPVYDAALNVRIDNPIREPKYTPVPETINKTIGDNVAINAKSNKNADLSLFFNGTQLGTTVLQNSTISANATITSYGTQTIIAKASDATIKYDTIIFFVTPPTVIAALPANVKDGINYEPGDTSVTLVLYAPAKKRVSVLGDFSNWLETSKYQMKRTPDSSRYWLRITGLVPGREYGYQYLIDGTLKVADYMTEKILDPWNDQYIPSANYPALKPYPTGLTSGYVGILQTAKPVYPWQVNNFVRPNKKNLLIYELLVRDFVAAQNWQTLKDTLNYLKKMGVNAIGLMPFNEFEGNNSWGYNPTFFFAPDKQYGTENALKAFIDACHKAGIAVIMDIVFNHTTGLAPTAQMYWNSTLNQPAANSPWYNQKSPHPLSFGPDFNHQSAATKVLVSRMMEHWLTKYKIDGFRWDLSKGFTQTPTCVTPNCDQGADYAAWGAYDVSRINIWKAYYDSMQVKSPGSYCILEHFADNSEEIALSNYGMLLWGNTNTNFSEAAMGYLPNSNFQGGLSVNRGWPQPHLVTYQESHDEERLMYKNIQFGNSSGGYNTKDVNTALRRMGMNAAFWAAMPGPKMMWQFGELGYDYSINTCEDLTVNNNCRLSPKPIRWDYQYNSNRLALKNVYSKMLLMRNVPNYLPTFTTNNVTYDLSGAVKWMKITSDSLKILVIGNFDVTTKTGNVTFQNAGTWYNYLQGGTRTATGGSEAFTLLPDQYYVFVNRNVSAAVTTLPLKLISFGAKRTENNIALNWVTSNEVNVKHFAIERSFNAIDFKEVGSVNAVNGSRQTNYSYNDNDPLAIKSAGKIFYRLRMVDIDGKFSYSNVAVVNSVGANGSITIYPNPAKGAQLYFELEEQIPSIAQVSIEDVSGRVYSKQTFVQANSNQQLSVDIKQLSNGVYLLKVETGKKSVIKQFVVQH